MVSVPNTAHGLLSVCNNLGCLYSEHLKTAGSSASLDFARLEYFNQRLLYRPDGGCQLLLMQMRFCWRDEASWHLVPPFLFCIH